MSAADVKGGPKTTSRPVSPITESNDFQEIDVHSPPKETKAPVQETSKPLLNNAPQTVEGNFLTVHPHTRAVRWSLDTIILVLPCLFIALAGVAAHIDGREVSDIGRHVESAAKLGPTIYPIVFAGIVARFMRHLARWQAEGGQRLGILEQLVNSQSLVGAILSAYNLQNLRLASIAIMLLWILSPIGGQSSLRLVSFTEAATRTRQLIYAPVAGTTHWFGGLVHYDDVQGGVNALISASLLATTETWKAPIDTWGNPKIPVADYLSGLKQNESTHDATSVWQDMSSHSTDMKYSSLIGVPLWGVPDKGNAVFTIRWPITSTSCQWRGHSYNLSQWCDFSNNWYNTWSTFLYNNGQCTYNRTTNATSGYMLQGGSALSSDFFFDNKLSPVRSSNTSQLHIDSPPKYVDINYTIYDPQTTTHTSKPYYYGAVATCELKTVHADVEMSCTDGKCHVARMRKSNDSRPDFLNVWNDASVFPDDPAATKLSLFGLLLKRLPQTTGTLPSVHYASAFDTFLNGMDQPFAKGGTPINLDWTNVSGEAFSERFAQLYNSFYIAAQWPVDVSDKSQKNFTILRDSSGNLPQEYQEADASITVKHKAYQANYIWIVLLVLVSIVLFFCALASLVLRHIVTAPDILGFVSSLTRDNIFFPVAISGGSTLNGEDRARVLRDVKVQIADVRPDDVVGHIAFTNIEYNEEVEAETGRVVPHRVMRGRMYD